MRYAAARREPNPASDPRSGYAFAYARRSNPPKRRISNAACPSAPFQAIFRAHFGALGAKNAPRACISPKKCPQKALQGRLQLAPSVPLRVKLGATCLTAAYLPGADSGPRPAPSRPRGRVRDWGQAFGLPRHVLSILFEFFTAPDETRYARNTPFASERAINPRSRDRKNAPSLMPHP